MDVPTIYREHVAPSPNGLDADYSWHIPGLLYLLTGLDRSMFELYALHANRSIDVRTYQAREPIIDVPGLDQERWTGVVQGLPATEHQSLLEHLQSYVFRGQATEWTIELAKLRIADPFRRTCWPMTATVWLPKSDRLWISAVKHGGLTLERPRITITRRSTNALA